jgi:ech hydrogenase subunit A
MNLLGGLGYAVGIIWFAMTHHTLSLSALVSAVTTTQGADAVAVACVALLAFAALTKSAQMPFSQWLLGAMVAPTPSSALLHSATMVKAGVYLLLRLAPAMSGNWAGIMVAFIGGFTFFVASLMAISQSDGKKVLAYSTISNLGLITACAGIGVAETVWAGLFLIIFHAVSKSMLFQAVGAVENATGSRDIEDMQGLILRLPKLACVMVIGICGMFLAPFGMLVSKWAALKAFVDASGLLGTILVLFVCFGSATTLLYWSKWLTKLLALNHSHHGEDVTEDNEYLSLFIHAAIMLLLCVSFPMLSQSVVQPIVTGMYGSVDPTISTGNLLVMVMLLLCVFIFPLLLFLASRNLKGHVVMNYMAGVNAGDGRHFIDSMGEEKEIQLSAWYLSDWFGEEKLMGISLAVSALAIIMMMALILGGVFA